MYNSEQYRDLTNDIIEDLNNIVGRENVITKKEDLKQYSHDEMAADVAVTHYPELVIKPKNTEEISRILKLANEHMVPITPRGAGTGLSGGAVPIFGGILIVLDRLNRILEIDHKNLMITVEAGVPFLEIYRALEATDLFFPLHPGDESAQIGGAVATNAGGALAIKYGVMRNYVRGAEFVLPTGEILNLGGKLMKNNTGYNLLHLLIGSEGTLGIFTKIIIRLLSRPKETMVLLFPYEDVEKAISTVPRILTSGIIPMGLEYIERDCITPAEELLGEQWPDRESKAFLIVFLAERNEEELYSVSEEIARIGEEMGSKNVLLADRKRDQEVVMNIRSRVYEGLKPHTIDILDIGVPPSTIAEFVHSVKEVSKKYGMSLPVYGHAGDGNVHVQLMKTGLREDDWPSLYPIIKKELFEIMRTMGGVLTAEHGLGVHKVADLRYTLSNKEIDLMRGIKQIFDPNTIMNPGKVIPPSHL